ncbi:MAG: hypothetical protein IJX38_06595 [Clostridia bacterium]|nr:hypothetical protein [Clostridia bacterium]
MNNTRGNYSLIRELIWMLAGQLVIAGAVVGVYAIVGIFLPDVFTYRIFTGLALGAFISIANYAVLNITVNRAIDKFIALRGTDEMDEEQAVEFAQKNAMAVQNAATKSYIIRMASMVATLLVAFLLLKIFDPIATAVPLLMFRPILFVIGLIRKK